MFYVQSLNVIIEGPRVHGVTFKAHLGVEQADPQSQRDGERVVARRTQKNSIDSCYVARRQPVLASSLGISYQLETHSWCHVCTLLLNTWQRRTTFTLIAETYYKYLMMYRSGDSMLFMKKLRYSWTKRQLIVWWQKWNNKRQREMTAKTPT